ncbi:MAG: HigA family addiction module antitoxin [Rhodospirillaceae bacterium]|nr:HigA family addiction module antitoxin [Rhodospirillaceae bacterium]
MATDTNPYRPDYAVPPGWILEERLKSHGMSHAELARRCGRSTKLISEIVAGKASLEPETALQFEKVLGVDADIWIGIEADYRLDRARKIEAEAGFSAAWARSFPVASLVRRGCFERPVSEADTAIKLLTFFGVASVDAWARRYGLANGAYQCSSNCMDDEAMLATWLRLGEIGAERQDCADYTVTGFRRALREIRGLTGEPATESLRQAATLCNENGVALALVPPLPKSVLTAAARWLSPRKAVIQLSTRYKSDGRLWFGFFHEAAHILFHSKKKIFVDARHKDDAGIEAEANEWALSQLNSQQTGDGMPTYRRAARPSIPRWTGTG